MNRLWVRLSLMIAGVLIFVFSLQFVQLMQEDLSDIAPPLGPPPTKIEIAVRLLDFMGLSLVVGLGGGILISRAISRPIAELAQAARRVGKGELDVSILARGSQEIRALAETFNKMTADLQQAEILRTNLMADVSHELRTPLTALEGNLRAALDGVVPLDDAEIANLYSQTRHLTRLVNDLRELSLAESGQLPMEKIPTNLSTLIVETTQALEPLSIEKGLAIVNEVSQLPEIIVDPFRIRQVLFNLLTNALRHTPTGGNIVIKSEINSAELILSVQDTGDGLDEEQLAVVFERFYRGDKSRSRETGGTGLGLAIVKAIVEAHGGKVEAYSEGKGKGSQFRIILPK